MTHLQIPGADYGVHVIVPVVSQSVYLNGRATSQYVGDVIVSPVILGWHAALVRNRFGGDKFWVKMIIPVEFGLSRHAEK